MHIGTTSAQIRQNEKDRPLAKGELFDPWERQFESRNHLNEFLKALEGAHSGDGVHSDDI